MLCSTGCPCVLLTRLSVQQALERVCTGAQVGREACQCWRCCLSFLGNSLPDGDDRGAQEALQCSRQGLAVVLLYRGPERAEWGTLSSQAMPERIQI